MRNLCQKFLRINYKAVVHKEMDEKHIEPRSLQEIEKRLLEIEKEKPRRIHNASENYSESWEDEIEALDIAYLDVEKATLQMKRQFILDKRNAWKARVFWSIVVPIIVATVTAYFVSTFIE